MSPLVQRATAIVRSVPYRIYSDFLLPSRLPELRRLLVQAREAGYRPMTHDAFWRLASSEGIDPAARYFLLRHDIDTDPATARLMHDVVRGEGAVSTFFFRLETFDVGLAREIEAAGSEVGYHYEELATLAKRAGAGGATDPTRLLPAARAAFVRNISGLRAATGLPMTTAASHGDFVNRRLGVTNTVVLSDEGTRERGGIRLEAYDEALMSMISSRHSDTLAPDFWRGGASPADAIARDEPVVYVLIHPRHWRRSPLRNARDDARRMIEGTSFRLGIGIRRSLSWRGSPA